MRIKIIYILIFFAASMHESYASDYIYQQDKGVVFGWQVQDPVGIYTTAGSRIYGEVKTLDEDTHNAILTLNGWSTKAQTSYYAYAPYNTKYVANGNKITELPILLSGQNQSTNNSTEHLSAFDFMMGKFTTEASTADISLTHICSMVRIDWKMPREMKVADLTLSADTAAFVTTASMNLVEQSVRTEARAKSFSLSFIPFKVKQGEALVAYMMIMPVDLDSVKVTATLTATDGTTITEELNGTKLLAAHAYPITIGAKAATNTTASSKAFDSQSTVASIESSLISPSVSTTDFALDDENEFLIYGTLRLGDVNADGKVDEKDPIALRESYTQGKTSELDHDACDVNQDGEIDILDAVEITSIILKKKKK